MTTPLDGTQRRILQFVTEQAQFAQVFTLSRDGFPVGRTMGAPVAPDWTVTLVQRRAHHRLAQLRRNPRLEIVWSAAPAADSTNEHPHVFDFDWLIPQVVFLRGTAEFMDDDWTLDRYQHTIAALRAAGHTRAPLRTPAQVREELVGIRVHPIRVRAEGFGAEAETFTWQIARQT